MEYDVFIIGSGVAGRYVAKTCAQAGLTVAIADNREYGGTCANRGCDPKKIVMGPTEVYDLAENLEGKGIAKLPKLSWKKNQKFKKRFTDKVPPGIENKLKDLGVELYHQSPKFLDKNTLLVEGKTIKAKKIVIATGQIPRSLDLDGAKFLRTSDDFLKLKKMPKSMIFIGAGYVGLEFAHMAARYGSKVTVIDRGERALDAFDADLASELVRASEEMGIKFIFNSEIKNIEKLSKNYRVNYKQGNSNEKIKARLIFNTAGRVPAIDALNLDKGEVTFSEKGVTVNKYLQSTSNDDVYACGDVSSHSVPLTPLSSIEAKVVSDNIINGNKEEIDVPLVPSAVFTIPNLAMVGLSEAEAKKRYKNVIVKHEFPSKWYNVKRSNEKAYGYKIIINERTNEIVGAHILGPQAAETINLFTLAINLKLTTEAVKKMIFIYPSWSNDVKYML
ncbi:NAD(P)/FAD-dependent oxidoreductase [Tamlana sp. 2_MG-2023]|uniref:dihydrolipoyl dehydrogenase family protein n=1 Tax=unclassified Tamlana TaxID=2614803 RepID=UPI0026E2643B|nr:MULTISPECIES: NAD(P)/FAD-dependent oxidoreductase [unclassified Tamlana]MDO6760395.1 NAD(P)/FAD-dependent oxidoreductase [Tamlana sp. 2_MG-2023]MDO6789906.1 NAD(P)/FAD-dependent oxidoreductase [Tamlana sp. 1_MG-2023]